MSFPKDIRNADGASVFIAKSGFQITPNDAEDLPMNVRALTALVAGQVLITTSDGDTFPIYLNAGQQFILEIRRVHATDTEATGLVGLV